MKYAEEKKSLDERLLNFLLNENEMIDVKAAVINAIGWDFQSTSNAKIFLKAIQEKYSAETDILNISGVTAAELMCYGYLLAMDDYFDVFYAATITQEAANKSNSFTIHFINAIVAGQKEFDYNFCAIWEATRKVLNDKSLFRDMRRNAIQKSVNYLILYKSYC
ncbi:MAG: hypothetical protein ACK4S0_13715 [Sediminibacterium sp.]